MTNEQIQKRINKAKMELGQTCLNMNLLNGDSPENLALCAKAEKLIDTIDRLTRTLEVRAYMGSIPREVVAL